MKPKQLIEDAIREASKEKRAILNAVYAHHKITFDKIKGKTWKERLDNAMPQFIKVTKVLGCEKCQKGIIYLGGISKHLETLNSIKKALDDAEKVNRFEVLDVLGYEDKEG